MLRNGAQILGTLGVPILKISLNQLHTLLIFAVVSRELP